jgi:hypothetical protein
VAHGLLTLAALVALLCVPCLLAFAIFADVAIDRTERSMRGAASRWRTRREAAKLERSTGLDPGHRRLRRPQIRHHRPAAEEAPAGPPFEQVAADLRRLARQRADVANRSPVWFAAVHRAYDERLRIACRELEISEHLQELEGIDLEIERLRVEGLLEAAGLNLAVIDTDGRQDTR